MSRDARSRQVRLRLSIVAFALVVATTLRHDSPVASAAAGPTLSGRNIRVSTHDLLPADQFETRRLPARPVRGFGLVEPVAVRRA